MKWLSKSDSKTTHDKKILKINNEVEGKIISQIIVEENVIDKMIEQVEDLKAIVRVEQLLNDRMLEILNEISDK